MILQVEGRPWTIPPKDQAFSALLENGRVVTWGNPRAGGGPVYEDIGWGRGDGLDGTRWDPTSWKQRCIIWLTGGYNL